ncbi:MAG TPA: 16S rRNA (guanine(527)-N(7))-methyltransferase RsmG [Acetobacteraceae bacterium]
MSAEESPALQRFAELLIRWNRSINLVSRGDIANLWTRHVADSVQLARYWGDSPPARGIDLGSGAGFPGLVLAIQFGVAFDLVEQDAAKAAFLREAARVTAAPVTIHATKIEAAVLPPAPLVTARALAPLSRLLGYAERLLAPGGICLFLKGRGVETEITDAAPRWHMRVERFPSATDANGMILRISELAGAGSTDAGQPDTSGSEQVRTGRR